MSASEQILSFLRRIRKIPRNNFFFAPRNNKTRDFMIDEGLNFQELFDELLKIEESHYHKGPESDHNKSEGIVMSFIYPFDNFHVYIKIKIWKQVDGTDNLNLMSFHKEGKYDY